MYMIIDECCVKIYGMNGIFIFVITIKGGDRLIKILILCCLWNILSELIG